jgi:hypothetical protein
MRIKKKLADFLNFIDDTSLPLRIMKGLGWIVSYKKRILIYQPVIGTIAQINCLFSFLDP